MPLSDGDNLSSKPYQLLSREADNIFGNDELYRCAIRDVGVLGMLSTYMKIYIFLEGGLCTARCRQ